MIEFNLLLCYLCPNNCGVLHTMLAHAQPAKSDTNQPTQSPFKWDGTAYAKNSTPQADRNADALKVFGLSKDEEGADFGCGNAKTTHAIGAAVKTEIGIDLSESMVAAGKKECADAKNITITQGSVVNYKLFKPVDFITSFFCLQWVAPAELPTAIANIHANLKENGRACILVPCYDFPHVVIKGLAFSDKWKHHFEGFKDAQTFYPESFYRELFVKSGFNNPEVVTLESNHRHTDDGFIEYTKQWCGCYSWLKDENVKREFINDIKKELAKEEHNSGTFNVVQKSIRVIAKKSATAALAKQVSPNDSPAALKLK